MFMRDREYDGIVGDDQKVGEDTLGIIYIAKGIPRNI